MTRIIKTKAIGIAFNKSSIYILAACIAGCLFSYILFANAAVRAITNLEKAEDNLETIRVALSEMESKRLFSDNIITAETARKLGFVEVSHQTFIVNRSSNISLSYKTD